VTHGAIYSFGPFALDADQRVLLRAGEPLRLTPKETDVLVALVERHGELVEKSRFFDEVWRGVCVEECNLAQHVAGLRRALGDDAREPMFIETVPRRGYRFVARVTRGDAPAGERAAPPPAAPAVAAPAAARPEAPSAGVALAASPPPAPAAAPPSIDARVRRRAARSVIAASAGAAAMLAVGWELIGAGAQPGAALQPSVAVLPFANLTGDVHQDALAETLTRALVGDLAARSGLRVEAARPASGSEHGASRADWLVETALLSGEGRVRIAAELIDTRRSRLAWAGIFDTDPVSFLDAEEKIADVIAEHLAAPAAASEEAGSASAAASAEREAALARQYLRRRTPQVVPEAIEHFTAATQLDPRHAPAHVGLADAYLLGAEQRVLPPSEALASAETAARRALELDPRLAEAHGALGEIAAARWDFEAAEASFRRALQLDPAIARVHEHYAALLTVQDRHEEAVSEARVARDLDPRCPAAATALAAAYFHAGRTDEAIQEALGALRLTPRFAAAYDVLGWAYDASRRDAEAVAAFAEAVRLSLRSPTYVAALARAHARAGSRAEARQLLSELEHGARERTVSPFDLAEVLAALGETDEALGQVERAVAMGAPWLQRVDSGLSLTALHDRAGFRELVARMRRASAARREAIPGAPAQAPAARVGAFSGAPPLTPLARTASAEKLGGLGAGALAGPR
jgi:DNA-binding winged helix-turn-helix (wHTH) protein/tetratricopeptide (TPR) repeat protein